MRKYLNRELLRSALDRIENFDQAAIEAIIERVPESHLPSSQKAALTEAL
jgi:hypothetical protein